MKPRLGLDQDIPFLSAALSSSVVTVNYLMSSLKLTSGETIWLVGDARSGATWLANMINHHRRYRFMFEPFHPILSPMSWFEPFQYLRPDCEDLRLSTAADDVFSGRFQHRRVDQFNSISLKKGLVIKDIFTHLMMGWVKKRYPNVKIVLMLRHPCAVAVSKTRLKEHAMWSSDVGRLLSQPDLVDDFVHRSSREAMRHANTYFENMLAIWCIIHYVPLCQFGREHLHLVFYEELCTNPEDEIRRLLAFLGHDSGDLEPRLIAQLRTPSQTCRDDSAVYTNADLISWWRSELTRSQINKASQILEAFGLSRIYQGDTTMPSRQAAESFLDSCMGESP